MVNGAREPNSEHIALLPGVNSPDSDSVGTSTAGVRIPPSALPYGSRAIALLPVTSIAGEWGGGVPRTTQAFSAANAARTMYCSGPSLMLPHSEVKLGIKLVLSHWRPEAIS